MMRALSGLADAALLLPAAVLVLAYLLVLRERAAAWLWALVLTACALSTLASKLLFHACGSSLTSFEVVSPSGHASLATVFYGCLAILIASRCSPARKAAVGLAVAAFLLLVGVSRVRTGAHSPEEVVLGFAIGGACVALFWRLHRRAGRPTISPVPLAIGLVAAIVVLGGSHISLEPYIGGAARRISARLDVCAPAQAEALRLRRQRQDAAAGVP